MSSPPESNDAEIAALEAEIEAGLSAMAGRPFSKQRRDELVAISDRHAALAWSRATRLSGLDTGDAEHRWAGALVERPLFILGAHRSGTTLVRNLLDAHPELSVLPSEGNLLTNFDRPLRGLPPRERAAALGRIWIGRLVLSDSVPPFWLLGRSGARGDPYVEFARRVRAWIESRSVSRLGAPYDAFVAVILAFTEMSRPAGQLDSIRYWAEKSPLHELHLARSLRRFPQARCVHVVRDPRAALVSRRILAARIGQADVREYARLIARSLKLALRHERRIGPAGYHVLRYEDLVAAPEATLAALCAFLGIQDHPVLRRPTVTGRATRANSAHARANDGGALGPDSLEAFSSEITEAESKLVRRLAGRAAARLGYDLGA